jgi:hypothetical protein
LYFLDPISEAASEEERRAALSILRHHQRQYSTVKLSTSSSLSCSANDHCHDDTTLSDDLSTLSDIDEQNTSMGHNSFCQIASIDCVQHKDKKRHCQENCSAHAVPKIEREFINEQD